MSGWVIKLQGRDARAGLAAAYGAVARLLPSMEAPARLFVGLNAWSETHLDEVSLGQGKGLGFTPSGYLWCRGAAEAALLLSRPTRTVWGPLTTCLPCLG